MLSWASTQGNRKWRAKDDKGMTDRADKNDLPARYLHRAEAGMTGRDNELVGTDKSPRFENSLKRGANLSTLRV